MGFVKVKVLGMDVYIKVEHTIKECLGSRKICLVVYIDFTSAFDVVWPGLVWKLINKNVKGKMIAWLNDYICQRKLKVRVDATYSDEVTIEAGIPQEAVLSELSPLLFNLMLPI